MCRAANGEGVLVTREGLLMGQRKKHSDGRVSPVKTPNSDQVIEWTESEREPCGALPVLQLYRWSDLAEFPRKAASIFQIGAGDSSSALPGGVESTPHREAEDGPQAQ
mgnify:CR=1 FL=1